LQYVKAVFILCRQITGWLLAFALIFAPWAWGTVKPAGLLGLEIILATAVILWVITAIEPQCRPQLPRLALLATALLLLQGWWMAINAHRVYNARSHQFSPGHPLVALLPGAADRTIAVSAMLHVSVILMALLMACDFVRDPAWRMRYWKILAITGASIAIYALGVKAGIFAPMFKVPGAQASVFGSFVYHGVAGAYLNLAIPAQCGMAMVDLRQAAGKRWSTFWMAMAMITVVGVMVNISRGAAMICVGELALLTLLLIWMYRRDTRMAAILVRWKWFILAGMCVVLFAGGLAVRHNLTRWETFYKDFAWHDNGRLLAWRVGWGMASVHPLFGSGPGSFKIRFSVSHHWIPALYSHWLLTYYVPGHRISRWCYASNDYLQTLIQWGAAGLLLWGVLVLGALWPPRPWPKRGEVRQELSTDDVLIWCSRIALAGVLIHGLFDYPLELASLELDVVFYLALNWTRTQWIGPT
jgi:hypothetical protein